MEASIIGALLFCIVLSCVTYYLGYFYPDKLFAWKSQASFIITTFLLIPLLIMVLYLQNGAQSRLKETGFVPLPSIQNSVGISVGIGDSPTWVFETTQEKNIVLNYYRDNKNRIGWNLISDSSIMLIFNKENKKMIISITEGRITNTLIFSQEKSIK